jgi:demethylmenaquinone methyltransferase/2-methoxy-6-polyprenyl-1,4-benzoquinol methylase
LKLNPADPHAISIGRYRRRAAGYDASARRTMPLRERTIALLALRPGDVVIDVGAGTGLSYGLLLDAVGPHGRVFACEQSPEMFERARSRARALRGGERLWHCLARAEDVRFPERADAVLFNYVHDVSRLPAAVANVMEQVKPGGRVAMAGMKFFPWWTGPLNLLAWLKNRPYNALAADLWSPWDHVRSHCEAGFRIVATQWGMGYIAWGQRRAHADAASLAGQRGAGRNAGERG